MKRKFLTLVTLVIITSSAVFGQKNKKSEDACNNIVEIKDEKKLIKSRLDADADYKKYKKEANKKILANQQAIAYLRINQSNNNQYTMDEYNKKIAGLEQKNELLRTKIEESFITKTCAWPEFKATFDSEMKELQIAIKTLKKKNKILVKD